VLVVGVDTGEQRRRGVPGGDLGLRICLQRVACFGAEPADDRLDVDAFGQRGTRVANVCGALFDGVLAAGEEPRPCAFQLPDVQRGFEDTWVVGVLQRRPHRCDTARLNAGVSTGDLRAPTLPCRLRGRARRGWRRTGGSSGPWRGWL